MTTEDQINLMIIELKRINSYLEKIDWKLWNLHEKYADPTKSKDTEEFFSVPTASTVSEQPAKAQLTKETAMPTKRPPMSFDMSPVEEIVSSTAIPKYPSIEDL